MSPLEVTTDRLLESKLGLKSKKVTLGFIRKRRRERDYPIDHATEFGGRTAEDLEELSDLEIRDALEEVDSFIAKYGS